MFDLTHTFRANSPSPPATRLLPSPLPPRTGPAPVVTISGVLAEQIPSVPGNLARLSLSHPVSQVVLPRLNAPRLRSGTETADDPALPDQTQTQAIR
jgi:hypothetical protein